MVDFRNITPCGGICTECEYWQRNECISCNQNGGKCVKLWEGSCKICDRCHEHDAKFCGLCKEFPCEWLKKTLTWDKDGIKHLHDLKNEYQSREADFSLHLPDLWNKIGTHGIMTLSTCSANRVTSRSMSMVVIDGKFYCQTNKDYLKCRQIAKNPGVALCFENYSVEGRCSMIGKPYDIPEFISAMEKSYPDAVKRWSKIPEECVLEIAPTLIKSWIYENNAPYIETWDFSDNTYRKEQQ